MINRAAEPEALAPQLLAAGADLPDEAKAGWLRLLGRCPTAETLERVRGAVANSDERVSGAAVRTLAEWPNQEAAGSLLTMASKPRKPVHKTLALQGYVRLAGEAETGRASMFAKALKLAESLAEKRVVLSGLAKGQSIQALDLVEPFLAEKDLREEAAIAAFAIASHLVRKERKQNAEKWKLESANALEPAAEKVSAVTQDKRLRRRAQRLLKALE